MDTILLAPIGIGVFALLIGFYLMLQLIFLKKPTMGTAIIRTGHHGAKIAIDRGIYVIPSMHTMELVDLTVKTIKIERVNSTRILLKDEQYAEMTVHFMIKIGGGINEILSAAQSIGAKNTFNQEHIESIFIPKFNNAIDILSAKFDSTEIIQQQLEFRQELIQLLGSDHHGYFIDDIIIENLTITRS